MQGPIGKGSDMTGCRDCMLLLSVKAEEELVEPVMLDSFTM